MYIRFTYFSNVPAIYRGFVSAFSTNNAWGEPPQRTFLATDKRKTNDLVRRKFAPAYISSECALSLNIWTSLPSGTSNVSLQKSGCFCLFRACGTFEILISMKVNTDRLFKLECSVKRMENFCWTLKLDVLELEFSTLDI